MSFVLTDLEEIGSAEAGLGVRPAIQTAGGATNLVFKRRFRVNANTYQNYLFPVLNLPNAAAYIQDKKYNALAGLTPAYLVGQDVEPFNEVDVALVCEFAMVPSSWNEYNNMTVSFPGVAQSSLYAPDEALFRSSNLTERTQIRIYHQYFLGQPTGIPTYDLFNPVDQFGNRTNVIDDNSDPSADEYISMINGRQEIVKDSPVIPWKGDIWEVRTVFALAQ